MKKIIGVLVIILAALIASSFFQRSFFKPAGSSNPAGSSDPTASSDPAASVNPAASLDPAAVYTQKTGLSVEVVQTKYEGSYQSMIGSGLIPVQSEGKYGYVDLGGNTVIPFKYNEAFRFEGEYALVQGTDGKYYIIDKSGAERPLMYEGEHISSESILQPLRLNENGLTSLAPNEIMPPTCYVDIHGKTVLPLDRRYDLHGFSDGYLLSEDGLYEYGGQQVAKWKDGVTINLGQDISHAFFWDGLVPFYTTDKDGKLKHGYADYKGDIAIEPEYDGAYAFSGGFAVVQKDDHDFVIDIRNRRVTPDFPLYALQFGYFAGRFVTNTQLIDEKGEVVYTCPEGTTFTGENNAFGRQTKGINPVFIVRDDSGKLGAVDKYGNEVLPCEYSIIHSFMDGLSTGVKDGKMHVFKLTVDKSVGINYTSDKFGFSVTLPRSWEGQFTAEQEEMAVLFRLKKAAELNDIGVLFMIIRNEAILTPEEAMNGAGARKLLLVTDKYSYVLAYPSDVQYDDTTEAEYRMAAMDIAAIANTIVIAPDGESKSGR